MSEGVLNVQNTPSRHAAVVHYSFDFKEETAVRSCFTVYPCSMSLKSIRRLRVLIVQRDCEAHAEAGCSQL